MQTPFERVYLSVGSNLGDRSAYLERAKALVDALPYTRFLRSSTVFETDPVGGPPQGKYLNAVWEMDTSLPPGELKTRLKAIEEKLGRTSADRNAPRVIDLDIIFYGDRVVEDAGLKIPHPRLHERTFVLEPLCEIAADRVHPQSKKTVRELLQELKCRN